MIDYDSWAWCKAQSADHWDLFLFKGRTSISDWPFNLTMYLRWPWTDPPASGSQVLELQGWLDFVRPWFQFSFGKKWDCWTIGHFSNFFRSRHTVAWWLYRFTLSLAVYKGSLHISASTFFFLETGSFCIVLTGLGTPLADQPALNSQKSASCLEFRSATILVSLMLFGFLAF